MTSTNADVRNRSHMLSVGLFGGKVTPGFGVAAAAILTLTVAFDLGLSAPPRATNGGATPVSTVRSCTIEERTVPAPPAIPG